MSNPKQEDGYSLNKKEKVKQINRFEQGIDYYINDAGNWVFTATYHLKRGYCCKNGCLHCPYGYKKEQQQ